MFSFLEKKKGVEVFSPVSGKITPLEEVKDPVFSEKMMGDGIAVQYTGGDVYAPVSGEITAVVFPSCHAFAIKSTEGLEVLVHVGLETVNLTGGEFRMMKKKGDLVRVGEKLLVANAQRLKETGADLITPVIITNSDCYEVHLPTDAAETAKGGQTVLLSCTKR